MTSKKIKAFKMLMTLLIILLISGVIIYIFPIIKDMNTIDGRNVFRDKISESGLFGMLWLFAIQVAQIFLIFVPGEPIEVLAGMCYGGVGGTLFIMISAAIISTTIFFLVRKFGKKFVYSFCSQERVSKIENSKFFQNPKKIEKILLILFLLPGTPKDFLAYVSGLLPIKPLNYIIISTFARLPSVISSTLAGNSIILGDFKSIFIIYIATFILVGLIIFIMNKFDKTKVTQETLNNLKEDNF